MNLGERVKARSNEASPLAALSTMSGVDRRVSIPTTSATSPTKARDTAASHPQRSTHSDVEYTLGNIETNQRGKGTSIMKVVIIGGSGLIGSKLVKNLRERGHEAVPASPDTGVNTLTGEGLAEALQGASVVVDVSNSPSFEDAAVMSFFKTSTGNLLAAEAAAGVAHHVALSVVGTERLTESGYFRAKLAQEELIEGSSIPYSIVRATQFYEFIKRIAADATDVNTVRLPPALIQPMAADDVASALARVSGGEPLNAMVEVAGPEEFRLD